VTTQAVVHEFAVKNGWTWRTSPGDALEVTIVKPGTEVVVQFTAGGAIRSARTKHGAITGKGRRDQVMALLRACRTHGWHPHAGARCLDCPWCKAEGGASDV
jgi:hypothetical protein